MRLGIEQRRGSEQKKDILLLLGKHMSKKFEQEDPFTKKTREEKKKLFKYNISNSLTDKKTPVNTTVQQKVLSQPPIVSRNGFSQMI